MLKWTFLRNNIANMVTIMRIFGTLWLFLLDVNYKIDSLFMIVYILTGFTDVLDGFLARKLNIQSESGKKLDSISDILFYSVAALKFDLLDMFKANMLRIPVMINIAVRIIVYLYVGYKKNQLHSRHTAWNKLTGFLFFMYPFFRSMNYEIFSSYLFLGIGIASMGTVDEVNYVIQEFSEK